MAGVYSHPRPWSVRGGAMIGDHLSEDDEYPYGTHLDPQAAPRSLTRPPSFTPSEPKKPYPTFRPSSPPYSSYSPSEPRSFTNHLIHPEPTYHAPNHDNNDPTDLVLPWNTPISYHTDPPMPEALKEERIRMLEQEFGDSVDADPEKAAPTNPWAARTSVPPQGPRKRIALRCVQAALALGSALSSIYVALFIHPTPNPAPPASTLAAYTLYLISIITLLLLIYLFLIRPCCTRDKRKSSPNSPYSHLAHILPQQSSKPPKRGKKGRGHQPISVNILLDPRSLMGGTGPDGGPSLPPAFAAIAHETTAKRARSQLKRQLAIDILVSILHTTAFVIVLFGKRCPIGKYDGWCTGYNTATACTCFAILAWATSAVFDVRDLSSRPPKLSGTC